VAQTVLSTAGLFVALTGSFKWNTIDYLFRGQLVLHLQSFLSSPNMHWYLKDIADTTAGNINTAILILNPFGGRL